MSVSFDHYIAPICKFLFSSLKSIGNSNFYRHFDIKTHSTLEVLIYRKLFITLLKSFVLNDFPFDELYWMSCQPKKVLTYNNRILQCTTIVWSKLGCRRFRNKMHQHYLIFQTIGEERLSELKCIFCLETVFRCISENIFFSERPVLMR